MLLTYLKYIINNLLINSNTLYTQAINLIFYKHHKLANIKIFYLMDVSHILYYDDKLLNVYLINVRHTDPSYFRFWVFQYCYNLVRLSFVFV